MDGTLARAVEDVRVQMIRSGTLDEAIGAFVQEIRSRLTTRLDADREGVVATHAQLIRETAKQSLSTPAARNGFNDRLADLAGQIVGGAAPQISAYVEDVIAGWEPEELNARFEEEIGPDLQFIRINGALLGALIGGALFAVETLLG
jgi:uncharacterized membrane-anchored protein YjiN (DUF445 family)